MDAHDLRSEEISTIEAIFPDLAAVDLSTYSGTVEVPVVAEGEVVVKLSASETATLTAPVTHLPPFRLSFRLPETYPYKTAPVVGISSLLLSPETAEKYTADLAQLWHGVQDQVLFSMVDHLQQKAQEYADSARENAITCSNDQALYEQLLDFDQRQKIAVFRRSTFTCDICQRALKGADCARFDPCGHVFCKQCLGGFFRSLIDSGDVEKVHCPDFACGKAALTVREKYLRLEFLASAEFNFDEFRAKIMTPPIRLETLHAILGTDAAGGALLEKYTQIYSAHQHALIAKLFPMRLVSCPRGHCQSMIFRENTQDRLVVCRACHYAFCSLCRKSFHSSSIDCARTKTDAAYQGIAVDDIELWIAEGKASRAGNELRVRYGHGLLQKVADEYTMDRLFNEMLREEAGQFSTCPTCDIVVQRSEGCNKMRCSHCYTYFCHLCSAFLDQDHPYDHFKERGSACYNRLFQGMPGTEDME